MPVNVIFDTNGDIRWVLKPDAFTNYDFRNLDRRGNMMAVTQVKDGDLIFAQGLRHFKMDLVGLVKRDQRLPRGYIDYSHDQIQMPNGDLLLRVGKRNYKRPDGVVVNTIRDQIIEVNADGDLVDEWNLPRFWILFAITFFALLTRERSALRLIRRRPVRPRRPVPMLRLWTFPVSKSAATGPM